MALGLCPACGTSVKRENLERHLDRVHPRQARSLLSKEERLQLREYARKAAPRTVGQSTHRLKMGIIVATLIVAAVTIGYLAATSNPHSNAGLAASWVGRAAPDFTLPRVGGGFFTLSDSKGTASVLLFFNEGLMCQPCLQQMVDMNADYQRFASMKVVLVAITTDSVPSLQQWASAQGGLANLILLSDQNLAVDSTYQTLGPDVSMMSPTMAGHTYILVDPSGIVKWRADYGPGTMYVAQDEIFSRVQTTLSA